GGGTLTGIKAAPAKAAQDRREREAGWIMGKTTTAAATGLVLAAVAACVPQTREPVTGRALYDQYCIGCHGPQGLGDGPAAAGLARAPADLSTIARRNGGTFPLVAVMSTIDGYSRRGDLGSMMPEMGAVMAETPVVLVETSPGVQTPTPEG